MGRRKNMTAQYQPLCSFFQKFNTISSGFPEYPFWFNLNMTSTFQIVSETLKILRMTLYFQIYRPAVCISCKYDKSWFTRKTPSLNPVSFALLKFVLEKKNISWQIEKWVFWEFCQKSQAKMQVNNFLSIICCSYHEQVYVSFFQSHRTIF